LVLTLAALRWPTAHCLSSAQEGHDNHIPYQL